LSISANRPSSDIRHDPHVDVVGDRRAACLLDLLDRVVRWLGVAPDAGPLSLATGAMTMILRRARGNAKGVRTTEDLWDDPQLRLASAPLWVRGGVGTPPNAIAIR
jgi:hypothetical protein